MLSFQLVLPNSARLSIMWSSTWRVSDVLPSVISLTNFPAKFVKADNPCIKGSWTRWNAKSTVRVLRDNKSEISSFTVVTDKYLQFSGGECFSACSFTVSVDKPPTSMLLTSSAIVPAMAGEVFLLEVKAWVRLSSSEVCDPGSGFFAGVDWSQLLVLFVPSTSSTADSTLRVFQPMTVLSPDMSSFPSSSERSMRSSLKLWRAFVWTSELLASWAIDVWRPWRIPAQFTCGPSSCPVFGRLAMATVVLSSSGVKWLILNVKLESTNILKSSKEYEIKTSFSLHEISWLNWYRARKSTDYAHALGNLMGSLGQWWRDRIIIKALCSSFISHNPQINVFFLLPSTRITTRLGVTFSVSFP